MVPEVTPEDAAAVDETAGGDVQSVAPEDQALAVETAVSRETETPEMPTPEEARAMFDDRPGLASVDTTDGVMLRDGRIE